ncbi:hypothetical protein B0H13DRAFT_1880380 [Mycena leptocephala]|nr:hypothetical protein B0H13DRAFT_1880380 [Mycena leptocephala]
MVAYEMPNSGAGMTYMYAFPPVAHYDDHRYDRRQHHYGAQPFPIPRGSVREAGSRWSILTTWRRAKGRNFNCCTTDMSMRSPARAGCVPHPPRLRGLCALAYSTQVLAERESEFKDLHLNISEFEDADDLHSKFEAALAHLEEEIYVLENDCLREDSERMRDDGARAPRGPLHRCQRPELEGMTQLNKVCSGEIHEHRDRQERLASHVEDLVAQLQVDAAAEEHAGALRAERRILDAKVSALQSA